MPTSDQPELNPLTRHYGRPGYPVTISGDHVTAELPRWYPFGKRTVVSTLADYAGVGDRIVRRRNWGSRLPSEFRQVVLVHHADRSLNIPLFETRVGFGESHTAILELRRALEQCAKELALPLIDSDRPPRFRRGESGASPEQVFETRFPDELDWSVRELVNRGRLSVNRDLPPPPRGLRIMRSDDGLRLSFRYSALWETCRITGFLLGLIVLGWEASHHRHGSLEGRLLGLAILCGAVTAFCLLVILPIKYFFNGSELHLTDERWTYRPAPGSLLLPSVKVLSQLKLSEIEEIHRYRRDVVIVSDRETVRVRCSSRTMALWMEQALLAVAAYGVSAIDGYAMDVKETADVKAPS